MYCPEIVFFCVRMDCTAIFKGDDELLKLFDSVPEHQLSTHLIELANERGGKDNITSVLVWIPDDESGVDMLTKEVNLKLEILHRMPLFRYVSYQELVRIVSITSVSVFSEGECIMKEGDEGDALFVVLSGKVSVHSGDAELVELGPGQHFGEMALIDKSPRSASVSAIAKSKLLVIRREDFFSLIRKDHDVAVKLLWSFLGVLAQRLRSTSRELGDVKGQLSLGPESMGTSIRPPVLFSSVPPPPPRISNPDDLKK